MSQHTPGPWEAYQLEGREGSDFWWICAGNKNGWRGDSYMEVSGHIGEANARLIAAAPEMLLALRAVVEAIEWRVNMPDMLRALQRIITKAEGR